MVGPLSKSYFSLRHASRDLKFASKPPACALDAASTPGEIKTLAFIQSKVVSNKGPELLSLSKRRREGLVELVIQILNLSISRGSNSYSYFKVMPVVSKK